MCVFLSPKGPYPIDLNHMEHVAALRRTFVHFNEIKAWQWAIQVIGTWVEIQFP